MRTRPIRKCFQIIESAFRLRFADACVGEMHARLRFQDVWTPEQRTSIRRS